MRAKIPLMQGEAGSPGSRVAWIPLAASMVLTALAGALTLAALVLPGPQPLRADGGTLRVANEPMGAYRVNVYTDPTPVPPDTIDVSLLVTFERGRGVATGLDIMVVGRRVDGVGAAVRQAATRGQATDPRFYAANFALGSSGVWEITIRVEGPEGQGEVAFQITVRERGILGSPYLILVLALLPLLLVGWWLRASGSPPREQGGLRNQPPNSPSSRPGG